MRSLVVTPVHNEANNIGKLAEQLAASSSYPSLWVVVNDGSSDETAAIVASLQLPFHFELIERDNRGGLIGGSAFTAWQYGVDWAMSNHAPTSAEEFDSVMKLDADVELPPTYLAEVETILAADASIGLAGGVIDELRHREQAFHVPGPVKLYSRLGYEALSVLPRVVGFDVMDELAIKDAGLRVVVDKRLSFGIRRPIGASQGLVHGRRRNGLVCRWTGYDPFYFLIHAARYVGRTPYLTGSIAMLWGYARAGKGPYPVGLRRAHRSEQRGKLRNLVKNPVGWLRSAYGVTRVD